MSKKLISGLFWSALEVFIKRVLDLGIKFVLARLLFPEDFGVVAMAVVFTSFIQILNDSGMAGALIQKKEENLSSIHYNTAFWSNVAWSSLLYIVICFVVAPFAASYYNQPILTKVIPVLSISVLTSALNTVHKAQIKRSLAFKKMAFINNTSAIIAGIVSLLAAFFGLGIWAIVLNSVVAYLVSVPLFYSQTKWLPKLEFDRSALKEILGFGIFTTFTQLIVNISSNADYLLLGKYVSAAIVGVYSISYMMTATVRTQITSMLNRVMFPFYSQIQDDLELLKKYYLRINKLYAIILYPIMITFILFGEQVVLVMFGDKWHLSVMPLRILSCGVLIDLLSSGYNLLFRSIGMPRLEMQMQFLRSFFVYLPCIAIGLHLGGYIGVAYGVVTSKAINFFTAQIMLQKYFRLNFFILFKSLYPVLLTAFSAVVVVGTMLYFDINVIIAFVVFAVLYISMYFMLLKDEVAYFKSKVLKR